MSSTQNSNQSAGSNSGHSGMNDHVEYRLQIPMMKGVARFLWKCAGADFQIMERASYYDHMKHMGIGGVVLATTILAFVAMAFAIDTIFENKIIAVVLGLVWALVIFNLDRFIVSASKGDGKESVSGSEAVSAAPRLIMAVFIGITISAPLETYIFNKEIEREWRLSMDQLALSKKYEIAQIENDHNIEINEKVKVLENDAVKQQMIVDDLQQKYVMEMAGGLGQGKRGAGKVADAIKAEKVSEQAKLDRIVAERDALRNQQKGNENAIKSKQDSVMTLIKNEKPGFLDKIMMIERLSTSGKTVPKFDPSTNKIVKGEEIEIYGSAFWPIWLVRLLFVLIEITPVLLKLFLVKGAYEIMQDNVTQILTAKQGIFYEEVKDENNKTMFVQTNHNPRRIVRVIEHQNALEERNAKEAITAFADKELEEIKKNPQAFFPNPGNGNTTGSGNSPS